MTEYQTKLKERYYNKWGEKDQGEEWYMYMFFAPGQYDAEEDCLEFMKDNPDATFDEMISFVDTVIPPIVVVPDDDVDDEGFDFIYDDDEETDK